MKLESYSESPDPKFPSQFNISVNSSRSSKSYIRIASQQMRSFIVLLGTSLGGSVTDSTHTKNWKRKDSFRKIKVLNLSFSLATNCCDRID